MCEHYNQNRPICGVEKITKSLESKWGMIKHDIVKFYGCYKAVVALNKCGSSLEGTLLKPWSFTSWYIWSITTSPSSTTNEVLKDVPKWSNVQKDQKKTLPTKRLTS